MLTNLLSLNAKRSSLLCLIGVLLIISILVSISVVRQNFYLLLIIGASALGFLLLKSEIMPIALIIMVISFADWAVELGYLPFQIMWLPELLSGFLLIKALIYRTAKRQQFRFTSLPLFLVFILITLLSLIMNHSGYIPALLMLRLLFRYYILFISIMNLGLNEKSLKLIINVLVFVFVLQLPLSVLKLFLFGQGEKALGLSGHAVSAIFPLIAVSFLLSFYFVYAKKKLYVLGIFAFIGSSFIGGKRAFIFFLAALLLYLVWELRKEIGLNARMVSLGFFVFLISLYLSARLLPTLNPQKKIWGDFNIKYIINYAITYETNVTEDGVSTGRVSTMYEVFRAMKSRGISCLALGYGPGYILTTRFSDYDRRGLLSNFSIGYGMNGLSWLAFQVGYLGAIAYFVIFYFIHRRAISNYRKEKDRYWRSFYLGMSGFSFIMMVTSFFYSPYFLSGSIAAFYFCLAGIMFIRTEFIKNIDSKC